jgi:hypothetical protein
MAPREDLEISFVRSGGALPPENINIFLLSFSKIVIPRVVVESSLDQEPEDEGLSPGSASSYQPL